MIAAVQRGLDHPVEWVPLAITALSILTAGILVRSHRDRAIGPWSVAVAAAFVLLAALLARSRELAAEALIRELGRAQIAAEVARGHAMAAEGLWWWLWCAALLVTLPALAQAGRRPPARAVIAGGFAVGLAAVTGTGELAWAGLAIMAAGSVGHRPRAILAGLLAVAAWVCGAEAALARTLELAESADLARMGVTWWGRQATVAAGVAWTLLELRARPAWPTWSAGAVAAVVGLLMWLPAAADLRAWGPPRGLGPLAAELPVLADASERFVGGCVWTRGPAGWQAHELGRISSRHGIEGCPPPGDGLQIEDRPTLVLPASTPASDLLELGPGELHLLGQLASGAGPDALRPWRSVVAPLQILDPDVRRWRPLPEPLVVGEGGRLWRGSQDAGPQPGEARILGAALAGAPLRVDLVVLDEAGLTLAEVLPLCAEARGAHPGGVRCALGMGPAARWTARGP